MRTRAWRYTPITLPVENAVTVDEVIEAGKMVNDGSEDGFLQIIIKQAEEYAQDITGQTFLDTEYRTLRNGFSDHPWFVTEGACAIELRRAPFSSIAKFDYIDTDGNPQSLVENTDYFVDDTGTWPQLKPLPGTSWPADALAREGVVTIEFTAGYGASHRDLTYKIRGALQSHVIALNECRGDCECTLENSLPAQSKAAYDSLTLEIIR